MMMVITITVIIFIIIMSQFQCLPPHPLLCGKVVRPVDYICLLLVFHADRWPVPAMRSMVKRAVPDSGAEPSSPRSFPETHPPVNTNGSGVDPFHTAPASGVVDLMPRHNITVTSTPRVILMPSDLHHRASTSTAGGFLYSMNVLCTMMNSFASFISALVSHTFRSTQWQREGGFGLSVVDMIYSSLPAVTQKAIRRH